MPGPVLRQVLSDVGHSEEQIKGFLREKGKVPQVWVQLNVQLTVEGRRLQGMMAAPISIKRCLVALLILVSFLSDVNDGTVRRDLPTGTVRGLLPVPYCRNRTFSSVL